MLLKNTIMPGKLFAILIATMVASCSPSLQEEAQKPNVLFIAIDDLNDWTGVLGGHPQSRTPNIDELASQGMLFTNAHCAAPACNPSRVALLTGKRPTSTGIYINPQPWREVLSDEVTIPAYFKENGYISIGAGKIFHGAYPDTAAWDLYYPSKIRNRPADPLPENRPLNKISNTRHFDWGPLQVADKEMGDTKVADWVIDQLQKQHEKPFFLAAGIFRPHLPWYVPQPYFDNYPVEDIQLPPFLETDLDDVPDAGIAMAKPLRDHKKVIEHDQWKKAVQGYLASIEYADRQVGRIIDALQQSQHNENTIIVLWSDHGWHLGEKSHWRKFALWERATRVTFTIFAPGIGEAGQSSRPVNLVDIYPTLLDLTGLPTKSGLDGVNLRPLLEDPDTVWPHVSITTHGRGNHAIRDDQWRYIRYADGSEELYNLKEDRNEWTNLANDPANITIKEKLSKFLPTHEASSAPRDPNR
jgi:arylsulfatase A-like enzyme